MSSERLKDIFQGIELEVEDLFLLEAFQIRKLQQYALKRELVAILHAYSEIQRFLITKDPTVSPFITKIMDEYGAAENQEHLNEFIDQVIWDHAIGQWLIQNKYPEEFDLLGKAGIWNLDEISSITPLNGKIVIDVGVGTGNIAFTVVEESEVVLAIEPVTSLREFMRKKQDRMELPIYLLLMAFHMRSQCLETALMY